MQSSVLLLEYLIGKMFLEELSLMLGLSLILRESVPQPHRLPFVHPCLSFRKVNIHVGMICCLLLLLSKGALSAWERTLSDLHFLKESMAVLEKYTRETKASGKLCKIWSVSWVLATGEHRLELQ